MSYIEKQTIKHALTAIEVAESHHGAEANERLAELVMAIETGKLLTMGQWSLVGSKVDVARIKPIMDEDGVTNRNFAVLVLGSTSKITKGANISCSAIIDSVIDANSEVTDGSVIINSELVSSRLRDTRLEDAHLKSVRGSSGGNEITGDIEYATIAASGPQVFVTPYPTKAPY